MSTILSFQECYINGIIWYVTSRTGFFFSFCAAQCPWTSSKFLHLSVVCSFLLLRCIPWCVHTIFKTSELFTVFQFSSVQTLSCVWLFATPWIAARQASLSITDLMDMNLSELREMEIEREAWRAAIHGIAKSRTQLSNWTELKVSWGKSWLAL